MNDTETEGLVEKVIRLREHQEKLISVNKGLVEALEYAHRKLHNFVVVHTDDVLAESWQTGEPKILTVLKRAKELGL